MALREMLLQQLLLLLLGLIILAATEASQPNSNCERSCGSVSIPYPFGTKEGCYHDESFLITCNKTKSGTSKPFLRRGNIPVLNISLDGELRVSSAIAHACYNDSGIPVNKTKTGLSLTKFAVSSTKNKFTAVGCDVVALIRGSGERDYGTGCLSLCRSVDSVESGSCVGIGCCQSPIPTVGNETCEDAERNSTSYACIAKNSTCYASNNGGGYRCNCSSGFEGNPYLVDGCKDIDECQNPNPCYKELCHNFDGGFNCYCPKGYEGDGMKNGTSCKLLVTQSKITIIALCISVGLLVLFVGSSWMYWGLKKRKLIKLREKFFQQNGGLLLQQKLSNRKGSVEASKIYSADEIKKATNNYDESRVLGQGGYGIVYKGILPDNKVIAIKKSKIGNQIQIEQFINEINVLTQINHRNVVKLLGCCLETEVPLLVYEFITKGTLSDHIHDKSLSSILSWEKRLKIAAETAGALAYLHSATSVPIIHRDVKAANILLDDNFTAKVSDFGASRLVPLDQTQLNTLVQGTFGYLDPEYFHTSQLTEKSDVYSFGVVLAELLTGKMALSFDRPEIDRNLAMCFVSAVKDDRLVQILEDSIVNEGNIEELKEVANLAKRCLKVTSEDRPSMKEVAMELEGFVIMEKHPWRNTSVYTEETEFLLGAPTQSFSVDVGPSSASSTGIGYDSMRNEVLKPLDDGR
nr:wall-associated receptor kinase 2 [Quercus suber]